MLIKRIVLSFILAVIFQLTVLGQIPNQISFMEQATKINHEAARYFSENLTDADWFETENEMLLDAFNCIFEAKERFAWGNFYPDSVFYDYVLPLRVDDEPLQAYRRQFFEELAPRLDTLTSITRAALEVNLWLGEHVTFKPTDWADQGPLTTISCGFGRCGELMILTIDALRSVGIAARGVYVPLWSYQDNNHAWVEVLTEDGWKYIESTSPATRMNDTWFSKSVLRAPILLTKNSSNAPSQAKSVKSRSGYSLNVTENYIPPALVKVKFPRDWSENDQVWLSVFNYGSLRSLVELEAKDGLEEIELGHGDFVLLGSYQKNLFIQPFTAQTGRITELELAVNQSPGIDFTLLYPVPPVDNPKAPDEYPKWRNDLAREKRQKVEANRSWNKEWLGTLFTQQDDKLNNLYELLLRAPGNEYNIAEAFFMIPQEDWENSITKFSYLSDKDLRSVSKEALLQWYRQGYKTVDQDDENREFILSTLITYEYPPRNIHNLEEITYKNYSNLEEIKKDISLIQSLVSTEIRQRPLPILTLQNMLNAGIKIDGRNAASFWVDRLRGAGIPARKGTWESWLEFYWEGKWIPLYPDDAEKLGKQDDESEIEAYYQTPATVSVRWKQGGSAPVVESEFYFMPINSEGWFEYRSKYPVTQEEKGDTTVLGLIPGEYFFCAGRRNGRGDVAVTTKMYTFNEGEQLLLEVDLLPPVEPPSVNALELKLNDLKLKVRKKKAEHLLIVASDNEPSVRTMDQARNIKDKNLEVIIIEGLSRLGKEDLQLLALGEREKQDAPFVFYFDEKGKLLFTQSGYDLNLPSRIRNSRINRK